MNQLRYRTVRIQLFQSVEWNDQRDLHRFIFLFSLSQSEYQCMLLRLDVYRKVNKNRCMKGEHYIVKVILLTDRILSET